MANKINGIKQSTRSEYEQTPPEERKDLLWFVRDFDEEGKCYNTEIYLGNRQYSTAGKMAFDMIMEISKITGDDVGPVE